MSPEQIRGEPLDGRSDLFALGTCLVQMLTGALPFAGGQTSQAMLATILATRPRDLQARLDHVSPELRSIALRCLARAPRDRYPSGLELAEDLRGYLHARGIRVGAGEIAAELQTLRALQALQAQQALADGPADLPGVSAHRSRESAPWLTGGGTGPDAAQQAGPSAGELGAVNELLTS
jgi:serine/threonine protein kinase